MIVYLIRNKINKKVYIGQTSKTVEVRWKQHIKSSKNPKTPIHHAINKYGINCFEIKVLVHSLASIDELNRVEKNLIALYKSVKNGYNCQIGGCSHILNAETKEKISKSVSKNNKKFWLGKSLSEETKKKISETKRKRKSAAGDRNPMHGRFHSVSSIIKNCESNGSKPFEVSLSGNIIGIWINKTQCAISLGLSREQVRDCLNGRYKSSKGYKFRYL